MLVQESLEALRNHAEKGSPEAQAALGTMYRNGQGVGQDLGEAVRWFRQGPCKAMLRYNSTWAGFTTAVRAFQLTTLKLRA